MVEGDWSLHPNAVIAEAVYKGLSSLVRIAAKRKNRHTERIVESMKGLWETARHEFRDARAAGSPDFSMIQGRESTLRRLFLKTLWTSTRPYGNRETKRVYDWREGSVGPLNGLLNFAGAALRDAVVPRYPFPEPDLYQVRRTKNGGKKVLPKQVADKVPIRRGTKTHLRVGYRGNSRAPRVLLVHPSLPAMDFADAIRGHLIELCRECFINSVPLADSHRYIRLLIHRLLPFLDWIYTEGRAGRKDFYPDADRELRGIVLEIRANYGKHAGREARMNSEAQGESPPKLGTEFLAERALEGIENAEDDETRAAHQAILDQIRVGHVTDEDVNLMFEEVTSKAQRTGNYWHRVLLSGFPQPVSLRSVVFSGDRLLSAPSEWLYAAELPLSSVHGRGKADLVLFGRIAREGQRGEWLPLMILEIKTKEAFDFNLYGKKPRSVRENDFVPSLYTWSIPLDESEWADVLRGIPPKPHLRQLDMYEEALLQEYSAIVSNDPLRPKALWKGIVIVDPFQDLDSQRKNLHLLLESLVRELFQDEFAAHWQAATLAGEENGDRFPGMCVFICPSSGPRHMLKRMTPPEEVKQDDPFSGRIRDNVHFTLYISLPSIDSSGRSASWISKNWHILHHLDELLESSGDTSVVWIDLLGDFGAEELARKRLGLERRPGSRRNPDYQDKLQDVFDRVEFVNLREEVDKWVSNQAQSGLFALQSRLVSCLKGSSGNVIALVDGWSELSNSVPPNSLHTLAVLERTIIRCLPKDGIEVIWVDGGWDSGTTNEDYQRTCVEPLPFDSAREYLIDEIIWNVPTAPRARGCICPQYDHSRVIIQDTPTHQRPWVAMISVPHLRGWSRRFAEAAVHTGVVEDHPDIGNLNQIENMYGRSFRLHTLQTCTGHIDINTQKDLKRKALRLIPSTLRPRTSQEKRIHESGEEERSSCLSFHRCDKTRIHSRLHQRLRLSVHRGLPKPNRMDGAPDHMYTGAANITRGWMRRNPLAEKRHETLVSRRPPLVGKTEPTRVDLFHARCREVRRLQYAARYLRRKTSPLSSLRPLYDHIVRICTSATAEESDPVEVLERVRSVLLRRDDSNRLCMLLLEERLGIADMLDVENRAILRRAMVHNRDMLETYGMNLVLAALDVGNRASLPNDSPVYLDLWSSMARWQLYQMGFRPRKDYDCTIKYDFGAIHSNLLWRAETLIKNPRSKIPQYVERFGQLIIKDDPEGNSIWMVFPTSTKRMYAGLLENQRSVLPLPGWHRCIIDPAHLKETANEVLSEGGWDRIPMAIVRAEKQDVMFARIESDEGSEWSLIGDLQYGSPPEGESMPLRWVNLSQPNPETLLALQGYRPTSPPSDLESGVNGILEQATEWTGIIREVKCHVTIDVDRKVYRVDIFDGQKRVAKKETEYTDEVVRFLRQSMRTGTYLTTRSGVQLKWDPLRDVVYEDVIVDGKDGSSQWFNLSFLKPSIHRRSFFPESYHVPMTCEDLLATRLGDDIVMRVMVDSRLKTLGAKKYLNLSFEGLGRDSGLISLSDEKMGLFDVALLAECEQLVDTRSNMRYQLSIDVKDLSGLRVVHLLTEYPRMHDTLVDYITDLEEYGHDDEWEAEEEPEDDTVEEDGLFLAAVRIEKSIRNRRLEVIVELQDEDDKEDVREFTVLRLPSETGGAQSVFFEFIEREVWANLRGAGIGKDLREAILEGVFEKFEEYGISVSYE